MIIESILLHVSSKILDAAISNVTGDTQDKIKALLKGDPAQRAFQQALGKAVTAYAQGERLVYAQVLTQSGGILSDKDVIAELSKLLSSQENRPDTAFIGKRWRDALESPPAWRDFTNEAEIFVRYLESGLHATDVFRPFFDGRNLETIADFTEISARSLQALERQLANLNDLMKQGYRPFIEYYIRSNRGIRDQIRDFSVYIEEKTRDFVGRQFVFDAIHAFVNTNPRGYFTLKADPGFGKSALSAQLVKQHGYIHHFNIRSDGINKASDFLKNVCAQLIAVYGLDYVSLPEETTQDTGFLNKLLNELSPALGDKKCIIVVDALDEADDAGVSEGSNTLYLPSMLPNGVFVVVTSRRGDEKSVRLRIDIPEQQQLEIKQDEARNVADVHEFVVRQTPQVGIQAFIQRNGIDDELFIDHLVEKSQGNFIYLRLVLPEIESGRYQDLALDQIPLGLQSYYENHWQRIRRESGLDWIDCRLPVVLALTVMKKPVSITLIMEYSGINDKRRVNEVLHDFDQFLYIIEIEYDQQLTKCYRWYHASFFDFICKKEVVKDELVDLAHARSKVTNKMRDILFGEPK